MTSECTLKRVNKTKMKVAVFLKNVFFILWIVCPGSSFGAVQKLEKAEFENFLQVHSHAIIMFISSDGCPHCLKATEYLERIPQPENLKKEIHKRYIVDEDLAGQFMITEFPGIIYFRNEHPIMYTDKLQSADDLGTFVEWLDGAHEISVMALHDSTFEHLTQASTGATTGDWFVFFYKPETAEFMKIIASFESVALRLKHRMNFALVDSEANKNLVKRFDVKQVPHMILFKQGKMYRYEPEKYDAASLTAFIEGWYRNVKATPVPKEITAFDNLVEGIAMFIKERMDDPDRRWMILTGGLVSCVGLIIVLYLVCCYKGKDSRRKYD